MFFPWMDSQQSHTCITTAHTSTAKSNIEDGIYNYSWSTISLGLIFQEFEDSIHEGDGDPEEINGKILLLIVKANVRRKGSRIKYAFEAFRYIALLNSLLTSHMAHK